MSTDSASDINFSFNNYLKNISETRGGIALLTSAEANESSFEGEQWGGGHGVFTYFLLQGMRGDADGYGQTKDGIVTVGELFDYVRTKVIEATGNKQHPIIGINLFDRNLPLAISESVLSNSDSISSFFDSFPSSKHSIRFPVAGFNADIFTEQTMESPIDLIGIGAEVDAFAYLIAAKELHPPMAIGLFGDWGSGKSFFMEALSQRIHKITLDAQQSNQSQREISIYKYIAQIKFNAWQYVEGELWASLVEHIFRNLKTGSKDDLTLLQQRHQEIINKLNHEQHAQQEAQARKTELNRELSNIQELINILEKEREDSLKKLNDLKTIDSLKVIPITDYIEDVQTLKDLGLTKELKNAAELLQGADELRTVLERGNALITPLRKRGWKWSVTLIAMILIGPVVSLLLIMISDIPPITNAIVSIAAFLSSLTIVLKRGTAWLSEAETKVEAVQKRLNARRFEENEQYQNKIFEAQRQYNKKAAEYEKAKSEEKEKALEIIELEQELQRLTPGRLLRDFINERVGSQDYRKHLGIAALIRSDFEQLSHLITEENAKFEKKDEDIVKEDKLMINRIVLYIDDLDRCPPDRVVQVLQAVHLLLAFPLFVVVVAVDARWLSQSLQAHYKNLLTTNILQSDLELSKGLGRQASPQDYLEKIFQIPFWVRPLSEKARKSIVRGLVKESLILTDSEEDSKKQSNKEQKNLRNIGDTKGEEDFESLEFRRSLDLKANTELKPQSLDIEEIELEFMEELNILLGQTPRSVKRFVNIYRLIKAISLNNETKFVEDRPFANFKLVLFLLAVLTGLPKISHELFKLLREERSEIKKDLITDQKTHLSNGRTLSQVLETLRYIEVRSSQNLPEGSFFDGKDSIVLSEKEINGIARDREFKDWDTCRDLDCIESWLKQYKDGSWMSLNATELADWAPQVVRFSFWREDL